MNLDAIKLKALAAMREITAAVDFAEQASEAMEDHAFRAHDTDIESATEALLTAALVLDEMTEMLKSATADYLKSGVAS